MYDIIASHTKELLRIRWAEWVGWTESIPWILEHSHSKRKKKTRNPSDTMIREFRFFPVSSGWKWHCIRMCMVLSQFHVQIETKSDIYRWIHTHIYLYVYNRTFSMCKRKNESWCFSLHQFLHVYKILPYKICPKTERNCMQIKVQKILVEIYFKRQLRKEEEMPKSRDLTMQCVVNSDPTKTACAIHIRMEKYSD